MQLLLALSTLSSGLLKRRFSSKVVAEDLVDVQQRSHDGAVNSIKGMTAAGNDQLWIDFIQQAYAGVKMAPGMCYGVCFVSDS